MNIKTGMCVALTVLLSQGAVHAAQGDWLGRARGIYINPDASSSALNLDASSELTPELDFTWFATDQIGLELILATREHDISSAGTAIGDVALLPPTLTVQYHFAPDSAPLRPYAGVGLNYTRFYDINLLSGAATVDKNSWGPALQAGVDIPLNERYFFNLDIKKIWIQTDVNLTATGAKAAEFKINPLVFGVGVGMKF